MRLLNTKSLPKGGFAYVQPETGMSFNGMVGFNDQVAAIVAHRRKNRLQRSNPAEVTQDLHAYTCARLGNDPDFCTDGTVVVKKKPMDRLLEGARHAAEVISDTASGARILSDWLGDGALPVPQEVTQARSDVCTGRLTGNPCPQNQQEGWSFTQAIASAIQSQMQKKSELGLKVEGENELGTCKACRCFLKLKSWVPFEYIYSHTNDATMQKFPSHCWVVAEARKQQIPIPA